VHQLHTVLLVATFRVLMIKGGQIHASTPVGEHQTHNPETSRTGTYQDARFPANHSGLFAVDQQSTDFRQTTVWSTTAVDPPQIATPGLGLPDPSLNAQPPLNPKP